MKTLSDGYKPKGKDKVKGTSDISLDITGPKISLDITGPNPFNPSTAVSFSLEKPDHVRLNVYNVAGQRVATLVNELKGAGEHHLTFKADNLPSGVYFMRLITSSRTLTTKAVLLK
jgi:hypothetical protein